MKLGYPHQVKHLVPQNHVVRLFLFIFQHVTLNRSNGICSFLFIDFLLKLEKQPVKKKLSLASLCVYINVHTHTRIHIYIYVHISPFMAKDSGTKLNLLILINIRHQFVYIPPYLTLNPRLWLVTCMSDC